MVAERRAAMRGWGVRERERERTRGGKGREGKGRGAERQGRVDKGDKVRCATNACGERNGG